MAQSGIKTALNSLFRPRIHWSILGKKVNTFHLFGGLGYLLGILVGIGLAHATGYSIWVVTLIGIWSGCSFLLLVFLGKIITGKEELVYYRVEIFILLNNLLLLKILGLEILPYLDIGIMGIGVFMIFGRMGCYNQGCCHGLPFRGGVCYRKEHVRLGFPASYQGIGLFPIQLMESLMVLVTVGVGAWLFLHPGFGPGELMAWYLVFYGSFRFLFEYIRGDRERPYKWGLSEAQWTSLLLMGANAAMELVGWLPRTEWHLWAFAGLAMLAIVTSWLRHSPKSATYLTNAIRFHEIAATMQALQELNGRSSSSKVEVRTTSFGLAISFGKTLRNGLEMRHFSFSSSSFPLHTAQVKRMVTWLQKTSLQSARYELLPNAEGKVFHLFLY